MIEVGEDPIAHNKLAIFSKRSPQLKAHLPVDRVCLVDALHLDKVYFFAISYKLVILLYHDLSVVVYQV